MSSRTIQATARNLFYSAQKMTDTNTFTHEENNRFLPRREPKTIDERTLTDAVRLMHSVMEQLDVYYELS
jgi:hypothetical protein